MPVVVAVAGKGGTGKTTVSAILVQMLSQKDTVLAIDADPSSNLNMALGLELSDTVGDVREEMLVAARGGSFSPGIAKQDYIDLRINQSLVEAPSIDLLAMGRPEGQGCYCAANNMLRVCIDRLSKSYKYVVIDNEAGLEHLSRQTTQDVDFLLIVSDPSMRGITTAIRVQELAKELGTKAGKIVLAVNRVSGEALSPEIVDAIKRNNLDLIGTIPLDMNVAMLDAAGKPIVELPEDSPARQAVYKIAEKLGLR